MASQVKTKNATYSLNSGLYNVFPAPIIAKRIPTTADKGELGQLWIDKVTQVAYMLVGTGAGTGIWKASPAAGATTLASLLVTPGNVVIDTGTLSVAGTSTLTGAVTMGGGVAVTGASTVAGSFNATGALIELEGSDNAAGTVEIHANGGVAETVIISADQGTGVDSVDIKSVAGGITMTSGLNTADSFNIASTGGVDIDAGHFVNIASSRNSASAITLSASAGGIDITAAGGAAEDINITNSASINLTATEDAARSIYIRSNGGVSETIEVVAEQGTGAASILLSSTAGGVTITGNLATADSVNINTVAGGGVDIDGGTSGIAIDSTGAVSIQGAAASDFSVGGAGIDLSLVSALGRVIVNGEEAAADAITLLSAAGGLDVDAALQINVTSSQVAADALRLFASDAAGGIDIDCGTGGATLDSTGAVSIQAAAASDFSVSGAAVDLSLASAAGRVIVNGEEAAANAVTLLSAAGGIDADAALQINIASSQAAADAVRVVASNAAGGIDIDCGTGGATLDSTGAVSIAAAAASDFSVTGGGIDLTLASAAGRVIATAGEAAVNAIDLQATDAAGGVVVTAGTGGIALNTTNGILSFTSGTAAIQVGVDAVQHAVTIGNVTGTTSVAVNSGTGGIALASTGTGDITINSDDTLLLDADGVLELNSSAGAINIGNDADANAINVGSAGARAIQVGNATAGTVLTLLGPDNVGVTLQNAVRIMTGAGDPNGAVTAPAGSIWLRTDPAGAASRAYINTDSAVNWINISCAA
jgi:hypothetical protein